MAEKVTKVTVKTVDPTEQAYNALVDGAANVVTALAGHTLASYYKIGGFVDELLKHEDNRYGSKTLSNFSRDLNRVTGQLLQSSSLYKARAFSTLATEAELEQLQKQNWSWRNVVLLYAPSVRPELRNQILRRVRVGEIRQDQVQSALGDLVEATRPVRLPSADAARTFTKITSATTLYHHQTTEVLASLDELIKMPTARQPKTEEIAKTERELVLLEEQIKQIRERLVTLRAAQAAPALAVNEQSQQSESQQPESDQLAAAAA